MGKVKKIFFSIICLTVALFIFAFLWKFPERQIASKIASSKKPVTIQDRIELENSTRRTWAQILGGVFFLITVYFTWRRLTITQEGQITERFTRAIDQIGDKKHLEVRLGGIYALGRIAKDSRKDHWTIIEVLTTYIQANAPWRGKAAQAEKRSKILEILKKEPKDELRPARGEITPPADIQAILTLLGRRTLAHEKKKDQILVLMKTDLLGAYLPRAHLEGAYLWAAHLEGAYLWKAHLEKALLVQAHLEGATLTRAHLENAWLWRAHLEGADLVAANLKGAHLPEANLEGADLRNAHNLTIEQLSIVTTLFKAQLDPELIEQIKKDYPHLLEEPKPKK